MGAGARREADEGEAEKAIQFWQMGGGTRIKVGYLARFSLLVKEFVSEISNSNEIRRSNSHNVI